MHRAPCPPVSVVLEWEWTAEGVGCGKQRRHPALPPTLRPQGWGAAPPGADRRSGPMSPQGAVVSGAPDLPSVPPQAPDRMLYLKPTTAS